METKFELISLGDNSVTYDIGGGPMPAFSAFYAAGYPDGEGGGMVAIEHRTLEYFGTRLIPLTGITINGITFSTVDAAVRAINALDFTVPVTDQIGNLAAHTDIKSLDTPTVTMLDPASEDGTGTITEPLAFAKDIPVVPPNPRADVTALFGFAPTTEAARVIVENFGESTVPFVEITASNEGPGTDDLQIEAPFGLGSLYAYTADNTDGNRTLPMVGVDGLVHYASITPETYADDGTPVAKSLVTVPAAVTNFTIKFPRGAVRDTTSSYYIDTNGVAHLFTAAGTPLSNFVVTSNSQMTIEGEVVQKVYVRQLVLGPEYSGSSGLNGNYPFFQFVLMTQIKLPVLSGITLLGPLFLAYCSKLESFSFGDSFPDVTSIGIRAFEASAIKSLDLSGLTKLKSCGVICRNCESLREINIGGLDFSQISVTTDGTDFRNVPNMADRIIRADSAAGAAAFKAKFPAVSNWTVVVNS